MQNNLCLQAECFLGVNLLFFGVLVVIVRH